MYALVDSLDPVCCVGKDDDVRDKEDERIGLATSSKLVRTGKKLSALEERRNYEMTDEGGEVGLPD